MKVKILTKNGEKVVDLNRRKAIRERCLNCSGWCPKEASECAHEDCPLHPYRTGNGKQDATTRARTIRTYCLWCCDGQRSEVVKCAAKACPLYAFRKVQLDRSVEIVSARRIEHIELVSERETSKGIPMPTHNIRCE